MTIENDQAPPEADTRLDEMSTHENNPPDETIDHSVDSDEPTSAVDAINTALGLGKGEPDEVPEGDDKPVIEGVTEDPAKAKSEEKPGDDKKAEGEEELPEEIKTASEATQNRFREVISTNKDLTAQVETLTAQSETLEQDVEGFRQTIQYSQATPDEFGQLMEYSKLVKSGDPEQMRQGLALLDEKRSALALQLGEAVPGVDLLDGFPDLQGAVDDMQMTQEIAEETAKLRRESQTKTQQQEVTTQQNDGAQAFETAKNDGLKSVVDYTSQLAATDVDYPKIEAALLEQAQIIAGTHSPDMWQGELERTYNLLKKTMASQVTKTAPNKNRTPLRPGGGSGGAQVPTTPLAAIDQALGFGE